MKYDKMDEKYLSTICRKKTILEKLIKDIVGTKTGSLRLRILRYAPDFDKCLKCNGYGQNRFTGSPIDCNGQYSPVYNSKTAGVQNEK